MTMVSTRLKKCLLRTPLFIAYIFLGAWLFCVVEKKPEMYSEMSGRQLKEIYNNLTSTYNISMNDSEFTAFAKRTYEAVKLGTKVDWTYLNSTTYVFSALTTIGFGHMTPETQQGQLLTVAYCLIGLPITMLMLKTMGEIVVSGVNKIVFKTETWLRKTRQVKNIELKTSLGSCLLMVIVIVLGSVLQMFVETWSFSEGVYVWFVIFSTIGFGDYIPLQRSEQQSSQTRSTVSVAVWLPILIIGFYYLAGLCVMSAVLTSFVQVAEEMKRPNPAFINKRKERTSKSKFDTEGHCSEMTFWV